MRFLVLFLLVTNAFSMGGKTPTPQVDPQPSAKGVHFFPVTNYTAEEKDVLVVSEMLSNELFQSKCFETFMVNRKLIQTNGKTPLQVVEELKTKNLTVPVKMYYKRFSSVVGYRQPPSATINTNRKFHAGASACSRGSNLAHEWSHVLGFEHSYNASASRPFSVPYSVNAGFEACCVCNGIKNCYIK